MRVLYIKSNDSYLRFFLSYAKFKFSIMKVEDTMIKTVPAYIITGFLGSGKTTLLQKILTYYKEQNLKPAIVLNEIGETNVEEELFSDENVLEMLNGCICCSIQGDFTKELYSFLTSLSKEDTPDILLIEGTGVANPLEIVDALTEPLLINHIDLYSVINLLDASKYLEYQSIFSSSKEVRTVLKSQITTSTYILLNKIDLINEKEFEKVKKKVEQIKRSDAPVVEASYGNVDIRELMERRIVTSRGNKSALNLLESSMCGCSGEHTCQEHTHNHSFQAIQIALKRPIDRLQLERWLKQLPKTLVRGKGIVQLKETVGLFQFQYSSEQLILNRLKTKTNVEPCMILIGTDLNSDAIVKSFEDTFK